MEKPTEGFESEVVHLKVEISRDRLPVLKSLLGELAIEYKVERPPVDFESLPKLNEPFSRDSLVEFSRDFFGKAKSFPQSSSIGNRVFQGLWDHVMQEHKLRGGCDCWLRLDPAPEPGIAFKDRHVLQKEGFIKYAHELKDNTGNFKTKARLNNEIRRLFRHSEPALRDEEITLTTALFKRAARKRLR